MWHSTVNVGTRSSGNGVPLDTRQRRPRLCLRPPASTGTSPSVTAADVYNELSRRAGVQQSPPLVEVRATPLGRGLVAASDLPRGALATVHITNALVIADDPMGISVFSDRQHVAWQERHGDMPPALLEFLQGARKARRAPLVRARACCSESLRSGTATGGYIAWVERPTWQAAY